MVRDPETGALARAAAVAALGHASPLAPTGVARLVDALGDPDARVRAAAIGALARAGPGPAALDGWRRGLGDPDPGVRRRAAEVGPALATRVGPGLAPAVSTLLGDDDVGVVEAAAWALGELTDSAGAVGVLEALVRTAESHPDPLAREAAVASLGSIGDPAGLPAILHACTDRPPIRRRAVLALAPFEGPAVDEALRAALGDRDWQVRQAAEDLLAE